MLKSRTGAKGKESVSFFFPAYMDEQSIPLLVRDFHNALEKTGRDFEILIVEDHSPDNTAKVADALARQFKNVRVIHHPKNMGYGGVLTTGFSSARKELTGYTDGDAQFTVKDLPKFLDAIEDADLVLGYKKSRADGITRRMLSKGFRVILSFLFGLRYKDPNCGFKMLRTKFFPRIKPCSQSGFFVAEMLYNAKINDLRVKEVPVTHFKRPFGKSAFLGFRKIFKTLGDMVRVRFFRRSAMPYNHWNPLVRFYFNSILKKSVSIARLRGDETVFDFGCDRQRLNRFLPPGINYVGFDIVPENSDVKDFRLVKPDVIFALNVLEHLDEEELKSTLAQFRKMNAKKLVVSQPTEHFVSRALAWLHGYREEHKKEHKLNWRQVHEILGKQLKLNKMESLFTMQKISVWSFF